MSVNRAKIQKIIANVIYNHLINVSQIQFIIISYESGWNDWPDVFTADTACMLTEEKGNLKNYILRLHDAC